MEFSILPLHKHPKYLKNCCKLINSEWKRSDTARLRSLQSSCDQLPVSLILLKGEKLLGHLKLSAIPSIKNACFVESVIIDKTERGKGYGTLIMDKAEKYCRSHLKLKVLYLSTKGQEGFYTKLGYKECEPVSIYGCFNPSSLVDHIRKTNKKTIIGATTVLTNAPRPPPMPPKKFCFLTNSKTYMKKEI